MDDLEQENTEFKAQLQSQDKKTAKFWEDIDLLALEVAESRSQVPTSKNQRLADSTQRKAKELEGSIYLDMSKIISSRTL